MSDQRRALRITSTTNVWALAAYGTNAVVATNYLIDRAQATALVSIAGQHVADLWSIILLVASLLGLIAALVAPRMPNPAPVLHLEAWGAAILSVCALIYVGSLGQHYGWNENPTTQAYAAGAALGLWRTWQIVREDRKVTAALAHPEPADPAPLAEADSSDGS